MSSINQNGWNEYARFILKELESNTDQHEKITKKLEDLKDGLILEISKLTTKVAVIETKMTIRAGVTGGFTGLASGILVGVILWLITK